MRAILTLLLILLSSFPLQAQTHTPPRLIVVQCDGITLDDLHRPETPHLTHIAETASIGMMHCAPPIVSPLPVDLSESQGEEGLGGEVFGNAETPLFPNAKRIKIQRADPNIPSGIIDDPIALVQKAMDSDGNCVVIVLGDLSRAASVSARSAALRRVNLCVFLLQEKLKAINAQTDFLFIALRPPPDSQLLTGVWGRLTPVLAFGPHVSPGLLTSGTTRTTGLMDSVDVMPTIYDMLRLPAPASLAGRPMRTVSRDNPEERTAAIAHSDYVARMNGQAQPKVMAPLAVLYGVLVLCGILLCYRNAARWGKRFAPVLVFILMLPAALMLAPLLIPPTLLEYALRIIAWQIGLTVGAYLIARWLRLSPLVAASLMTTLLLAGDILTGQTLIKDSVLNCYALYGVRYYGIGNEYLGVLLGLLFLGGFAFLDDCKVPAEAMGKGRQWLLLLCWIVMMLFCGWPAWGANAGSLIVMGTGITLGAAVLSGKRPAWWLAVLGGVGGMLLAFIFAYLDVKLNRGVVVSHLGGALQSASGSKGIGYLLTIAIRKVGLNLSLLFAWWFLLAAAAVFGIALLARKLLGESLQNALARRPWTARSLPVMFAVGVAALIFKDTGVVTVTFLLGVTCLILFFYAFMESAPRTPAHSLPNTSEE